MVMEMEQHNVETASEPGAQKRGECESSRGHLLRLHPTELP
jgi:hypothetical protein